MATAHSTTTHHLIIIAALLLIPIANAQGVKDDRYVPPPLPEHEWVGKSLLNYTELHTEFIGVLSCVYVPIGVFGSFLRFSLILMNIWALARIPIAFKTESKKILAPLMQGLFTTGWSVYFVVASFRSLTDCSGENNYSALRNSIRMDITSGICSAIGGIMLTFSAIPPLRIKICWVAVLSCLVAIFVLSIQAPTLLFDVTRSKGITKAFFTPIQNRVSVGPYCVAVIVEGLLFFIVCILAAAGLAKAQSTESGDKDSWKLAATLGCVGSMIATPSVFLGALGNTLLGNIAGDPWGGYFVRSAWGKAMAVIAGMGLFMEILLSTIPV